MTSRPEHPGLVEVHITVPDSESGQRIASDLVARQLAACVQILGPMASVYTWKGEVHQNQEWLLLAKTTEDAFPRVVEVVRAIRDGHPPTTNVAFGLKDPNVIRFTFREDSPVPIPPELRQEIADVTARIAAGEIQTYPQ